jgi:hypothetical protein
LTEVDQHRLEIPEQYERYTVIFNGNNITFSQQYEQNMTEFRQDRRILANEREKSYRVNVLR